MLIVINSCLHVIKYFFLVTMILKKVKYIDELFFIAAVP